MADVTEFANLALEFYGESPKQYMIWVVVMQYDLRPIEQIKFLFFLCVSEAHGVLVLLHYTWMSPD